ncbi:immunoglobulin-like domain-containing protein [Clostridium sp. C45]
MRKLKISKLFSIFLTCILCLSFLPTDLMAMNDADTVKNGYYNESNTWVEGELDQALPEGIHSVNKTAVKSENDDNTYDITLEVVTEQNLSKLTKKSATILVIDTSGSMGDYQRLINAKNTAKEFVKKYAGDEPDSGRYLAIVNFATNTNIILNWTDVSSADGKASADNAINQLYADGGTNLHAGIKQASQLFDDTAIQDIESKNTIVLTDGAPTYYLKNCTSDINCIFYTHVTISNTRYHVGGDGDKGSETINDATAAEAKTLKGKSTVYTICYGASREMTYQGGPTVSAYLKNNIASEMKNAYDADDSDDLVDAFKAITETITSGLDGKGLSVFDGSAPFVSVSGLPESIVQDEEGFTWKLENAEESTEGNKKYYTYRLTYKVTLNADAIDFDEGKWYPLNGKTYITLADGEKVYFPIPAGQGVKTRYTVTYTDGVEDEEVFENQITTDLVYGAETPSFKGTPERTGYLFTGWTPEISETVSASTTYVATWKKRMEPLNKVPEINAEDKTLTVGDTFDPKKDVTATDKEDGDLTAKIEIVKNTVDMTKAGTYEVTYKVTDSEGASTTKTITVTVNPKMEKLNEVPTIQAEDKTLTVGDTFDPRKDVTATDKEDGDLTAKIEIVKNTVDMTKAGTYEVTYKVTDSEGASTTKTITVTVNPKMEKLNEVPTIQAEDKTLTVGDTFDPRKDVTATDKEDGDLTAKIEIVKNTVDMTKAGTYEVTYKVTDSEGASTTKTITVTVNPKMEKLNEVPTIQAEDKTLTVGDTFDPKKDVTATDKEDGDLTAKIEIVKNTVDMTKAGTYEVTYKVTDSEGASTTKTITVTVNPKMEKLNEVPTIQAEDKTLTVGDTFDPRKDVTATDKEDGDLTAKIEIVKNTVDMTKAGTYEVTYKVTDSEGASTTKTITITVKDKKSKVDINKPDTDEQYKDTGSVETGDRTNISFYTSLFEMSVVCIAILAVWKKKKALRDR